MMDVDDEDELCDFLNEELFSTYANAQIYCYEDFIDDILDVKNNNWEF